MRSIKSLSYNVALGLNGAFGDSDWEYDAYYARSEYQVDNRQKWPLTGPIEDFFRDQFLGPQLGTYYGYPVYHPDTAAFYQSLTPEEFDSFTGKIAHGLGNLDPQPQFPAYEHESV